MEMLAPTAGTRGAQARQKTEWGRQLENWHLKADVGGTRTTELRIRTLRKIMAWNPWNASPHGRAHLCLAVLAFSCAELGTNRSASPPQHHPAHPARRANQPYTRRLFGGSARARACWRLVGARTPRPTELEHTVSAQRTENPRRHPAAVRARTLQTHPARVGTCERRRASACMGASPAGAHERRARPRPLAAPCLLSPCLRLAPCRACLRVSARAVAHPAAVLLQRNQRRQHLLRPARR